MQIFLWNIMSEQSQSLWFTCFSIFIHTWFLFWPSLKIKCCLRSTAVFYHRYVQTRRTDTFSMILGGPGHVKSMAKKSKIFPGAPFFKIPFFWGLLVQAIKFSLFLNSSLVLLVTFKRIELEMPDWAHWKDLFKLFLSVTNFLRFHWKITKL